jgi:hypothetical protein
MSRHVPPLLTMIALVVVVAACKPDSATLTPLTGEDVSIATKDVTASEGVVGSDAPTADDVSTSSSDADGSSDAPKGPSVHGIVYVDLADHPSALQGASVRLADGTGASFGQATTNTFGDWVIPAGLPTGKYTVCVQADHLDDVCGTDTFVLDGTEQTSAPTFHVPGGAVAAWGRVTLADGTPCVWRFPMQGVAVDAAVTNGAGERVLVNHAGEFVFFGKPTADTLVATCEAAKTTMKIEPESAKKPVLMALDNHPPAAKGIVITHGEDAVRQMMSGDTYDVTVVAEDVDGQALTAAWYASDGKVEAKGLTATVSVPVPGGAEGPKAAAVGLEALVGDGYGGYALISLTTAAATPPYVGLNVVDDTGAPIAAATVTNGKTALETSAEGRAELSVDGWDRGQPIVVSAPGFVDAAIAPSEAVADKTIQLVRCEVVPVEVAFGGALTLPSAPERMDVTIPKGALRRADGTQPAAARVCMAVLEGDGVTTLPSAADAAGDEARGIDPRTAAWVDLRDPNTGERLVAEPPITVGWRPGSGKWEGGSAARLVGGTTLWQAAEVTAAAGRVQMTGAGGGGFVPLPIGPSGCVRLYLDRLRLRGDYDLLYRVGTGPTRRKPVVPGLDVLDGLPANTSVTISVLDLRLGYVGAVVPEWTRTVATGNVLRGGLTPFDPGYPYARCGGEYVVGPTPTHGLGLLSRMIPDFTNPPQGSNGTSYYLIADAANLRRNAENFVATIGAQGTWSGSLPPEQTAYVNRFDLGFGRRLWSGHVAIAGSTSGRTGFLVQNYNTLSGAACGQPWDAAISVGMEWSPAGPGGPNVMRFVAYSQASSPGPLLAAVDLDGEGFKPMPYVCLNCHGGDHFAAPAVWSNYGSNVGGRFIPLMVDTLGHGVPTPGGTCSNQAFASRAINEPKMRAINQMMLPTNLGTAARRLVHGVYGSTAVTTNVLPSVPYDDTWFPPGAGAAGWSDRQDLYRTVVAPYCRGCHLSFDNWDWGNSDAFLAAAGVIENDVCVSRTMPHARVTYDDMWRIGPTAAPDAVTRLSSELQGVPGWSGLGCPR